MGYDHHQPVLWELLQLKKCHLAKSLFTEDIYVICKKEKEKRSWLLFGEWD